MKKIIVLISIFVLSIISFSVEEEENYTYSAFEIDKYYGTTIIEKDFIMNICFKSSSYVYKEKIGITIPADCASDRDEYFNTDRKRYFDGDSFYSRMLSIKTTNPTELANFMKRNKNLVLMYKCGARVFDNEYRRSHRISRREDMVIVDYNNFVKKYKKIFDANGCIPR